MPRTILITGACGSLGSAAAEEFRSHGWLVFAADISPRDGGEGIVPVKLDVTDPESVGAALRCVSSQCDGLDAILHMAGLYTMDAFAEIAEEDLSRMLDVNLMGVYRVNKAFLPLVRKRGGRIIITASELAALDPLPFNGIYSMTKRALDAYAHALSLELDLVGVRVVTLYPGAYGDGMTKGSLEAMERMREKTKLYSDIAGRFRDVMLGELDTAKPPEELAARIFGICEKHRPRMRYFMNNSLKLRIFSALPIGVQAWALRLLLKGKTK